jgi:hypothetical protein
MAEWTPAVEGTTFELPSILEPLKNVRGSLTVLTGLTQDKARPNGDGPGDHARSSAAWLTGCQPRKTHGADIKVGISVDQLAAAKIGHRTPFASLELGCERGRQAGNCDSGYSCAYSSSISWRAESTPVAKETDPRLVFERLFSTGDPTESAESRQRRNQYRKSVLDFVLEDAKSLQARLGMRDRRKLDEYFSSVRDIEQRLARAQHPEVVSRLEGDSRPVGAPADYGDHIRLMGDMMVLAFQADLTRICTFMFANEGSNRPYPTIGIAEGHHDLSHHEQKAEKQEKIRQINRFHVEQLAYIVGRMDAIEEEGGTILDNSMVVYGGGIGDGNAHNHDDLPILLIGKGAGTITPGRHIRYPDDTPMANLFLSVLERVGVPAESIGDSTGRLQQLL